VGVVGNLRIKKAGAVPAHDWR
jgi:hypothetical protein